MDHYKKLYMNIYIHAYIYGGLFLNTRYNMYMNEIE